MSWIQSCKRIPNYNGWWDLVLKNANESTLTKTPLSIPFEPVLLEEPKKETHKPTLVYLNNQPILLPQKPLEPDNCCMSGCVHCVWDLYQEDMEEYTAKNKEIKDKFIQAGQPIPAELDTQSKVQDMDPSMKAFLEMEKKLNNL